MNVFIIGACGCIGRAVTAHVLKAGHSLTALVRSEAAAARLPPCDVRIVARSVEDLGAVDKGPERAHAAIWLTIQGIQGASAADRAALQAVCRFDLTHLPLIVTSGLDVSVGTPEPVVDETSALDHVPPRTPRVWPGAGAVSRVGVTPSASRGALPGDSTAGWSSVPSTRTSDRYLRLLLGWLPLGIAASTSEVATERAAVAALGLWSIHAEMAAPS